MVVDVGPEAVRAARVNPRAGAWATLALCVVATLAAGLGLRGVRKDPSVDAFVPQNHPAALARNEARAIFGLEDPIIVALLAPAGETAFTPARLEALRRADAAVRAVPGVNKNEVVSLASENAIRGNDGDLEVEPIIPRGAIGEAEAGVALARFRSMPMLQGLLASSDAAMTTLIVPVSDPNHALETVREVERVTQEAAGTDFQVHVAGVAAMNARLAQIVDADTRVFVPAAVMIVLAIVIIALRQPLALAGPLFVIAGSTIVAVGAMGWFGARYYLITTALPVVIMAIAVADTLHISTFYLRARAQAPALSAASACRRAIRKTLAPVTLTSVTTIAAFLGLSFGAAMTPISEFGIFAAIGVAAAWALSLTALPAIIVLTDLKPRRGAGDFEADAKPRFVDRFVLAVSRFSFARPRAALSVTLCVVALLAVFAARAEFDYERKQYFAPTDPVRISDHAINKRLGGVNFLDVMVSGDSEGALMKPEALKAIAALRELIGEAPFVEKVSGIDEYISLMHAALSNAAAGTLPDDANAPTQYMFLYEASAPPEDFKQEIDYNHQRALIRAQLSTDRFSDTEPVVRQLEESLRGWRADAGLDARISGRVAVNDGWMSQLADTHFVGLGMAAGLVFLTVMASFRSLTAATLACLPVFAGVLSVYALMGAFSIDIAPATSMTAAIATGLGVDFGIHLVAQIRRNLSSGAVGIEQFCEDYGTVARACFWSAIALFVALSVVSLSGAPPLRWFGALVAVGAFGSLVGALFIMPALMAVGWGKLGGGRERHA